MRIACAPVCSLMFNRKDQWVSMRTEGRIVINIGYGLSQMGHDVDIVHASFDPSPPGSNPRLRGNFYDDTVYDVAISWNPSITTIPEKLYKKMIFFVEPSNNTSYLRSCIKNFPKAKFFTASLLARERTSSAMGVPITYFPQLFPIPCHPNLKKQDFFDFEFDKNKKDIKVWAFINAWNNYHINSDDKVLYILRRLRDRHGYNIDLSLHVGGEGNPAVKELNIIKSEFNAKIINNLDMCYLDMLNLLSGMDICITKGGWCYCGNCAYDIISLGKLMFYTTEGMVPPGSININNLYPLESYVIRQEDSGATANEKIDRIIADPDLCYSTMKKTIEDSSFPCWSKTVEEILRTI